MSRSNILKSAVLVAFFAFAAVSQAVAGGITNELDSLLSAAWRDGGACGVAVVDLDSGATAYTHDADLPLIPASNQKLLVMAAALEMLGPDFEFETQLGLRGADVIVFGDGDPATGDPKYAKKKGVKITDVFADWSRALIEASANSVPGDIVLDESIFDDRYIHPSWEKSDLQKWYAAPVGSLNFNNNCIEVTAWPVGKGGRAAWSVEPANTLVRMVNRTKSTAKGTPIIARPNGTFEYVLSGSCGKRSSLIPVTVPDPGLFFGDVLREELVRNGLTIGGGIRRERVRDEDGTIPPDVRIIARAKTPLADVLRRIGKNSHNLFAECLAKRLGFERMKRSGIGQPRGSWVTASAAIQSFFREIPVDTAGAVVADASGLSRDNRATARQMVSLLVYMHGHKSAELFAESLAVGGKDGSLRRRMKDAPGLVIGKTGTLRGVRALSGYIIVDGARRYAFSMIFNGIKGPSAPYKRIQDAVCKRLAKHAG